MGTSLLISLNRDIKAPGHVAPKSRQFTAALQHFAADHSISRQITAFYGRSQHITADPSILRQTPVFFGRSQLFTADPSFLRQIPAFYGRSQLFTADPSILRQFCCCPAFYRIPWCRVSRGLYDSTVIFSFS